MQRFFADRISLNPGDLQEFN